MKKKLISLLLCVTMVASMAIGCGSKEEPAAEAPAATEEAEAPAEEAGTSNNYIYTRLLP